MTERDQWQGGSLPAVGRRQRRREKTADRQVWVVLPPAPVWFCQCFINVLPLCITGTRRLLLQDNNERTTTDAARGLTLRSRVV